MFETIYKCNLSEDPELYLFIYYISFIYYICSFVAY